MPPSRTKKQRLKGAAAVPKGKDKDKKYQLCAVPLLAHGSDRIGWDDNGL